jgi:peptide/nickel transport system substrate-binding protein
MGPIHGDRSGQAPDLPQAVALKNLYERWLDTSSADDQAKIWHEMLGIWADQVYTIGLVAGVLQPVVVNDALRNVPRKGMYNWDPGAQFGIYKPDGFWFDRAARPQSAALAPTPRR